ncbi:MAG TPA: tRNA lysidine(34) synthetase TilS [Lentisphaeria bacterium]|nr:MAG: tRNA lysidine(34) synthetase TilS [Lentisphaerae bacterium GWF2_49_21]HBC85775.1 tRNA lysidine(34) synthetase TilS [Lentisphaeria bacterium]
MDLKGFFGRKTLDGVKNVFAGFSGGPDSTALLILLDEESKRYGFHLKAVHFEHGLRGKEGVNDAGWCRKFCEFRNIDFMEISLDVNNSRRPGESIESAARRLRLREWNDIADGPSTFVALGHNANDKIENVFLRLLRGSNASGLTSLREVQKLGKITIIRPILHFRRKEIEDYLRSKGVADWRIDSTNSEDDYRRNFFRNKVIPLISERFPNTGSSVLKSVYALEQDAEFIEAVTCGIFNPVKNRKSLEVEFLKALHPAILVRFLRLWISEHTASDFIPDSDFITRFTEEMNKAFEKRMTDKSSSLIPIGGDHVFLKFKNNSVSFCEIRNQDESAPIKWKWGTDKEISWDKTVLKANIIPAKTKLEYKRGESVVYFDADALPDELHVRQCKNGDKMIPFGKDSSVHLKKLFESKKMDSECKAHAPVVCTSSGEIIWIPSVRRANFANIGPEVKRIVVFTSVSVA